MFFQRMFTLVFIVFHIRQTQLPFFVATSAALILFVNDFAAIDHNNEQIYLRLLSFRNHFHAVRIVMYIKREDRVANKI